MATEAQLEADRKLAMELEGERVAESLDPWKKAEREWEEAMNRYNEHEGEKAARKLAEEEAVREKARQEMLRRDAELARKLADTAAGKKQ